MTVGVVYGKSMPRARLSTGDLLGIELSDGFNIFAKVLEKSVMAGFASAINVYDVAFPAGASSSVVSDRISRSNLLLGTVLGDADLVRSGLMKKIGKASVALEELQAVRFVDPIAEGDHPLAARFDPATGSFVLQDRSRESDFLVDIEGRKVPNSNGMKLGLWRVVPNVDAVADRLDEVLSSRGDLVVF